MTVLFWSFQKASRASLRLVFLLMLSAAGRGQPSPGTAMRPVDYVNPLIGTAPMTDSEYLGNNPPPGEELYYGCVNPGAMVPTTAGRLCVGPVSGYDGQRYHVRGSGYRFTDATLMVFTILNGEYHDDNKLLFMPTTKVVKTIPGTRADPLKGCRSAKVPASQQANVLLGLANSQPLATNAAVHFIPQHTLSGFQDRGTDTVYHLIGNSRIYFYAVFSKDFSQAGIWKNGAVSPGSVSAPAPNQHWGAHRGRDSLQSGK